MFTSKVRMHKIFSHLWFDHLVLKLTKLFSIEKIIDSTNLTNRLYAFMYRFNKPKKHFVYKCHINSFQKCMAWPLIILKVFWIFPLNGIMEKSHQFLEVKTFSWVMVYAAFCSILQCIYLPVFSAIIVQDISDRSIQIRKYSFI